MFNVDGAIFFNLDKVEVGCLLRDFKGDKIMATSSLKTMENPKSFEAIAMLCGLYSCVYTMELPILLLRATVFWCRKSLNRLIHHQHLVKYIDRH